MEIKFVNPLCDPDWDRLVVSHPDFNFFHSAAWAKVLSKTYGHEPVYLRCSQRCELVALVPMMEVRSFLTGHRGVCLPFTDFCGPLIFGKYFELRGGKTVEGSATPALAFYGHTLDLRSDPKDLLTRLKSSARRALRKAERSGLSVQVASTWGGHGRVLSASRPNMETSRYSTATCVLLSEHPR